MLSERRRTPPADGGHSGVAVDGEPKLSSPVFTLGKISFLPSSRPLPAVIVSFSRRRRRHPLIPSGLGCRPDRIGSRSDRHVSNSDRERRLFSERDRRDVSERRLRLSLKRDEGGGRKPGGPRTHPGLRPAPGSPTPRERRRRSFSGRFRPDLPTVCFWGTSWRLNYRPLKADEGGLSHRVELMLEIAVLATRSSLAPPFAPLPWRRTCTVHFDDGFIR